MATWVAFLRAINLGATRKFAKADIVAATEAAGFAEVATHINTGNVRVETTKRSRARIEEALEAAYEERAGFAVPTICFTAADLRDVAAFADEIGAGHTGRHYVSLLKDEPSAATISALEGQSTEQEKVHVDGRGVHLLLGENYHTASLTNTAVEKALGVATNRNVTVIRAIVEKWC